MSKENNIDIYDYIENDYVTFDFFYPNPKVAQDYCRKFYTTIFEKDLSIPSLDNNFLSVINRFTLVDIKLLEHPLIIQNIILYCKENKLSTVNLHVHHHNKSLATHYQKSLISEGYKVNIHYHNNKFYWKNSLTNSGKKADIVNLVKFIFIGLVQFFFLLINKISFTNFRIKNNTIIWHGFANNRQKVDYKLLTEFEQKGFNVIYPNPYIQQLDFDWNKSIYFLSSYSANPFKLLNLVFSMAFFNDKFNELTSQFESILPHIPKQWSSNAMFKVKMYLILNYISGSFLKNLSKQEHSKKIINVFRGGAAAGLVYAGVYKEKYENKNIHNFLVTHGTEFNVIDHFSYFYLDYNILPSKLITDNWNHQLNTTYADLIKYNKCTYVAGGRIDYELLDQLVEKKGISAKGQTKYIGIVLTYLTINYQSKYITELIKSFSDKFKNEDIKFVIKPRPNVEFEYEKALHGDNLIIHSGDIFSFLNKVDLIIGTVSTYGVLSMVVSDAIYCDVPAIYYMSNDKFNASNLGYSYHPSMDTYTFSSKQQLDNFIASSNDINECLETIKHSNKNTLEYLSFDKKPSQFLIDTFNSI